MRQDLTPVIKESFLQFGGAVLQSRALPDVRDNLKPSARQIFYCMYTDKFVHEKPFQKTLKAIGSAFRMYIHGDASVEGIIMRAGQPFSMRYPLVEVEGSYGTLLASGSWAASRYTSSRLSALSNYLFADIQKDTVEEWRDNYDDTEQYPMVLPSKGFYNIVNGSYGIGVGASNSVPQYNLKEVNEALIKLLWNPQIDFDEIYCEPDFATGGILLNAAEVKESHKNGTGKACKLRSVVEYDSKERCLVVTEIPYMVYTETICSQLEDIINSEDNPGIERFNDLTGKSALIKIYLSKTANANKVITYLYKNTSLQSHFGVNFTMLENGRFPRVFTWRGMLTEHLEHEIEVYTRGFTFDLGKIKDRLHIIYGLLKAVSIIDDVIALIRGAADSNNASRGLQQTFGFSAAQAKAILDIKLSRLAHLEISKLEKERDSLETERQRIEAILQDDTLLKQEIEKGLREVAQKFGDSRRTKVLNLQSKDDEIIEEKQIIVSLTNYNTLCVAETSTLVSQNRGGVGASLKLHDGEYVMTSITANNTGSLLFFSNKGRYYSYKMSDLIIGKSNLYDLLTLTSDEHITAMVANKLNPDYQYIYFLTKHGMIKKSLLSVYNLSGNKSAQGIKLREGDEVVSIVFGNEEPIGLLTAHGKIAMIKTNNITPIGRVAQGVQAMKLSGDDVIVEAHRILPETKELVSISKLGRITRSSIEEIPLSNRAVSGRALQPAIDSDTIVSFCPILSGKAVSIASTTNILKTDLEQIPLTGRGAQGVKGIKIKTTGSVVRVLEI